MRLTLLTALTVCSLTTLTQARTVGSGKTAADTRPVSGFHGVALDGVGHLHITQGEGEGLIVETDDNLLPLVETRVGPDGVLHLGTKEHEDIRPTRGITYKLTVKTLDRLAIAGSGDAQAAGPLKTDHLDLEITGSGDLTIEKLDTPGALKLSLAGAGDVQLSGRAASQSVTIAGSGDYDAPNLQTATATVSVSGSGDCEVNAKDKLDVQIAGSGSVTYHGSPAVTRSVSGSGTVHAVNEGKKED